MSIYLIKFLQLEQWCRQIEVGVIKIQIKH